ncbi:S1 family serine peptidase [Enterovibrio calviensis]|uniref:S1 family serine peptidase n=1 Tax=Enterovibrio calviensis TaxID=91359 RepID=UPI00054DB28B|nr:serine protease [Enterovibrio calviensis]
MRKHFALLLLILLSCFAQGAEREPRVVGGSDAAISDAPWQAFVRIGNFFCGGVVIGSEWVLTAAHCLDTADDDDFSLASANSVSVYTGTATIYGADFASFQSSVDAIHAHSSYDKTTLANDIALIKLSSAIHSNASSVVLASIAVQTAVDATADLSQQDLLLTGWGYIDANRNTSTNDLQKATLSTISDSACASSWGTTITDVAGYESKYFCAQESGRGACNGDSGGPLVWFDPSRAADSDAGATLVGLVSFGVNFQCASPTFPDVYTQVSNYLSWISSCQAGSCASNSSQVVTASSGDGGGGGGALGLGVLLWLSIMATSRHVLVRRILKRTRSR